MIIIDKNEILYVCEQNMQQGSRDLCMKKVSYIVENCL